MRWKRLAVVMSAALAISALPSSAVLAQESDVEVTEAMTEAIDVTLQEWAVLPETTTIAAGAVTFDAQNIGPDDPHELVIIRTDLAAGELPTREDGGVDEDAEGIEVIGEIDEFDPGLIESGTFDLAPGHYAFICNIVEEEDGGLEAHYEQGMWVDVEVT